MLSIYNAPSTAEKIWIKFFKPSLSAYYLLDIGWALGSHAAGLEKYKWYYRGEFSFQVAGTMFAGD